MNKRRIFFLVVLCVLLIFTGGCWDQDEVETLAIVRGMAIDYLPGRRAPYLVTLAVERPAATGGESGSGEGEPTVLYSGVGASIDLAIQQASFSLSRRIFLSHNELLVIGEEAAKEGLSPIMDFVIRNPQVRLNAFVLIAPGIAQEVLAVTERLEGTISSELLGMIQQANESSETDPQEVYHVLRQMATPGQDAHTVAVMVGPLLEDELKELNPEKKGGGEGGQSGGGGESSGGSGGGESGGGQEEPEQILSMDGMAVFRGDKLAGIINHIEARGVLWLTGGTIRGVITVHDPVRPGHHVNLLISRSETKVTPVIKDGRISFHVEVEAEGDIASQTSFVDLSTPEMIVKLNSAKAGAIKVEMEKALSILQELETDVVGFGKILNQKDPETFRKVADRWPEVFSKLDVEIHVEANIRRTGQHSHPTRVNR
ncbi:MAG: Ger(x)C family spore germination protein [Bacillota bacterium]|nr:Ger(x)C family spore germination protein [Bacillota bacterium]MDW7683432.1 Ger(x)C family spore germination protein [Bacillota bacterium]